MKGEFGKGTVLPLQEGRAPRWRFPDNLVDLRLAAGPESSCPLLPRPNPPYVPFRRLRPQPRLDDFCQRREGPLRRRRETLFQHWGAQVLLLTHAKCFVPLVGLLLPKQQHKHHLQHDF